MKKNIKRSIIMIITSIIVISILGAKNVNNIETNKDDINLIKNNVDLISDSNIKNFSDFLIEKLTIAPIDQNDVKGVFNPDSYQIDSEGNIFIFDIVESNIVKFNSNGKFLKKFGKVGLGPGEYKQADRIDIVRDQIIVCDQLTRKLIFFDNNGIFIKDVKPTKILPTELHAIDENHYLGFNNYQEQKNGKLVLGFALTLLNNNFNEIKRIWFEECEIGPDLAVKIGEIVKRIPSFAISDSRIFISNKVFDKYVINIFDLQGKLIEVIKNKYRNIYKTKNEIKEASAKVITEIMGETGEKKNFKKNIDRYKYSIDNLFIDKNNTLWVQAARDGKKFNCDQFNYYDQFNKDGVLVNTVKLDKNLSKIKFIDNKIYSFTNEDNVLKVFEY